MTLRKFNVKNSIGDHAKALAISDLYTITSMQFVDDLVFDLLSTTQQTGSASCNQTCLLTLGGIPRDG